MQDAGFDPALIYKVLGMYNPSETAECYFVLANPQRETWFIPQRHLRAYKLINSGELFMPKLSAGPAAPTGNGDVVDGKWPTRRRAVRVRSKN